MREKRYFYFQNPKTFQYTIFVRRFFTQQNNKMVFQNKRDKSLWIEEQNYNYYGEPVKCLRLKKQYDISELYDLFIKSSLKENVFGAINYMLNNHKNEFLIKIKNETVSNYNTEILHMFFQNDIK